MATYDNEHVAAILRGRRDVRRVIVALPGGDLEVGVRILTDDDLLGARLEAQRYLESRLKTIGIPLLAFVEADPEALDHVQRTEIVFRAFVDPDDTTATPRPFFPAPSRVREMDGVAVRAFMDVYLDHQLQVSPRGSLSSEEVDALCDALGKEPTSSVMLAHLEPDTLRTCVRGMALRLRATSPSGRSTSGLDSPAT